MLESSNSVVGIEMALALPHCNDNGMYVILLIYLFIQTTDISIKIIKQIYIV